MKRILSTFALAFFGMLALAQDNVPPGIRMEISEAEENQRQYSLFYYKDNDGTEGYYLSLGREYKILEIEEEDIFSASISHLDETCIWMGSTLDETLASLDGFMDLLEKDAGYSTTIPCRLSSGMGRLGESSSATCVVVKRVLQGKRLSFTFKSGQHTGQTDITKSSIKSLRFGINLYKKIHPKAK